MAAQSKVTSRNAKQWIGKPVYIELKDGSSYVGLVTGAERGQLIISGRRAPRKHRGGSSKRANKAQVSSFIPGLLGSMLGGGSLLGGGASPAGAGAGAAEAGGGLGLGGLSGIMGFMGKAWPMMKMGYGMIKTIMPMLQSFKA